MKTLVKRSRIGAAGTTPFRLRLPDFAIQSPVDLPAFPFHAKSVKGISEISLRKIQCFCGVLVVGPFATVMQSTMNTVGFLAFEFHDVNFTAGSPSAVFFVSR